MLAKTGRDLRRRLPQCCAIALTVLTGVLLFVASYDAYRNLGASYERTYERLHFADLTASGGAPDRIADAVRDAEGVAAVATRTTARVPLGIGDDKLAGRVLGLPAGTRAAVNRVDVTEGRGLSPGAPDGVLVERHAADTFHLEPGDTLRAYDGSGWRTLTVRGIAVSPEYLWPAPSRQQILADPHSFAAVFAPGATARALAGDSAEQQTLVRLAAEARDGGAADRVAGRLREAGAVDVVPRADQPSHATLQEDLKGFEQLAFGFPLLFLSAAAVASYVLLTRLVLAERKIIATFLAGGAPRGTVVRHYLGHGLAAGTAGGVLGAALGTVATAAVTRAYTSALDIPDTVVRNSPLTLALGLVFGVLVGVAGALAPALSASRTAPAEAMRGDAGSLRPPGRWSRLVARAHWLPVTGRMALRELTRSRRRTLATMTGTVLSLILVLASVGMITSLRTLLDVQFDTVQRQDATVTTRAGGPDLQEKLAEVPRVTDVERVTEAPVTVTSDGHSYATTLTGFRPGTSMHGFRTDDGGRTRLPGDGAVLGGRALTGRLDISVGDTLTVHTAAGRTTRVRLAGLVDEPLGTAVYATRDTARSITGSPGDAYQLRFADGTGTDAREAARARITGLPGVVSYTDEQALRRQVDDYLGLFRVFTLVMLVLGGALALTVISVTMTVNVAERSSELATLRAAGVSLRRLASLLATENLTATLLAVPLGLAAGTAAAWASLRAFNSDMVTMELSLGPPVLLGATTAVFAASLLSQLPAIRMVRRLDVARVVRERAQ
ncbi:FtsX-like permease family protein [Streptomyces sp. JJ36]|nr:FtsX-like permease family protein [Streptomyces sp. JJ36]